MLQTKRDVDRHVRDILSKVKGEDERKKRCFQIAKLYFNVCEYDCARRYLGEFLTIRPRAIEAHHILGQIYEAQGQKDKAVGAYRMAYELGYKKELVTKICDLYCEVKCDNDVRRHWVEEGERLFPHHDSVIRLRESLLTVAEDADKKDLEKFFLDEIKERPTDIRLQIRLVRLYEEWGAEESGRYKMAYDYSKRVEALRPFSDSREWYQALCDVTESYMKNGQMEEDSEAQTIYLAALERLTYLTIAASSSTALLSQCAIAEAVLALHKFDEKLNGGLEIIGKDSNVGQLLIGQLYLHMATVLLHPTNKDVMNQDQTLSIGALLLHACHYPPNDTGRQAKASGRDQHWYKLACHRMSQATHTLNGLCKDEIEKSKFLNKVKQQCSNKDTRSAIHRLVFGAAADKGERGFFINDSQFITAPLSYPEASRIKEYDHVVSVMVCANLNELVWLCLRQVPVNSKEPQPYYSFPLFDGLQFSSTYMNSGAPESMCHLDLLAFLAAIVFCHRTTTSTKAAVPTVVSSVCTSPAQCEWWSTAYTLFTSRARQDLGKLRRILQRGLEVIRAVGNHGIDLAMMAHLARCFSHWANLGKEDGSAASEVTALEERANHYWGQVLSMCQRPDANISSILPKNRMFVSQSDLTCKEREQVEQEGKYFSALRLVSANKKQEAIQALGEVKSPEASFQRAMLYKDQAEELLKDGSVEALSSEMRGQYNILLTQARDTLYLTLDRLRMPGIDRLHPLNTKLSQQLEEVEKCLTQLTADGEGRGSRTQDEYEDSLSEASHSPLYETTNGFVGDNPASFTTPQRGYSNNTSRIRRQEARPSPERLDAQMRYLSKIQETTMRTIEEQNSSLRVQNEALSQTFTTMAQDFRENVAFYRSLLDQNKKFSQESNSSVLNELKNIHEAIKDLQEHMKMIVEEVAEIRNIKATEKQVAEPVTREEETTEGQSSLDIQSAPMVPGNIPGLYDYVRYYNQQPLPSPLVAQTGLFPTSQLPFFPPSTMPEQSGVQVTPLQTVTQNSQVSVCASTPTRDTGSTTFPDYTVAQSLPSNGKMPSSLASSSLIASSSRLSSPVTSAIGSNKGDKSAPHAFQIAMPTTPGSINPLPENQGGPWMAIPLTTTGLLAGVPAPIFSAVSPATSSQTTTSATSGDSSSATKVFGTILTHAATSPIVSTSPKEPQPCASTSTTASMQTPAASLTKVEPEVLPEKDNEEEADNDRYIEDDHDPCPDFVPIIPLPDKVEVCTMEEDEEVLFEDRSKLFRFVEKEWKERGTGMIKLLYNKEKQTVRVLMRRDQTHKVCANHLINDSITPQFMANNDKALMWGAQDFADEELRTEKFCSRFKTSEIAANFKAAFENAKKLVVEKEISGDDEATAEEPATEAPAPQKPLSELFKPTAGSWSCDTCLVRNDPDKNVCVSCQTPNPSSTAVSTLTTDSTSLAGGGFKFGTTPSTTSESSSLALSTGSFKFGSSTQPIVPAVSQSSSDGINLGIGSDTETAAATTEQSKFSLGGFTFSSAPIVKPEENIVEKPVEEKKDSIFAKFSFTTAKDTSTSSVFPPFSFNLTTTTTTTSQAGAAVSRPAPISSGTFSFTSVACDVNSITTDSSKGESKPSLFRDTVFNPNSTSVAKADESQDGEAEEYEPQVDFKPVIPMPDLVEVKTGEENEDQLFCERAKLFRYDAKEWKERGIGEFKILRDKKSGKVRILMRREQIHKICANHLINQDMKLGTLPSSDRAWVWGALDYADEEVKEERFAVKFKTPEVANKFKEVFEEAQKTLGKEEKEKSAEAEPEPATETKSEPEPEEEEEAEAEAEQELESESEPVVSSSTDVTSAPSLASLFKPAPGSWECSGCFIRNKAEVNTCPACNTNKPGYEPPTVEETKTPAFSFGLGKSIFGSAPSTASTTTTVSFSFSCSKPQTTVASSISTSTSTVFSGFKFSPTNTSKESSTTKAFTFGTPQTSNKSITSTTPFSFSFASPSVTGSSQGEDSAKPTFSLEPTVKFAEPTTPPKAKEEGFIFGSPGKFEFSFSGVKTKSPRSRDVSVCESEEGVVEEDDGDHLYFEPVIPLPDKVDVVTGEENEEVLYSHRAKLYRLIQGEWKERGIGDIKVLKHNKTGKIRLLMRREQVLKLCLNHYMAADMEFRKKDDKTYYWVATDFSDGEPKKETFAARFKTSEIAHEFLAAVSNSKVQLGGSPLELETSTVDTTTTEVVTTSIANDNTKTEDAGSVFGGKGSSIFGNTSDSPSLVFKPADQPSPVGSTIKGSIFGGLSSFSSSPKTTFSFGDKFSTSSPVSSTGIPDSEVSIVFEKKATPEQVEKARKLKLPDNFYLYEQAEPCKGCIGCQENQDVQTKEPEPTVSFSALSSNTGGSLFGNLPSGGLLFRGTTITPASEKSEGGTLLSGFSQSGISFADIAKQETSTSTAFASSGLKSAVWAPKPVFGAAASEKSQENDQEDEEGGEEDDHDPHFEPVIPMPELVEVKTGEEGWNVVFCQRSKLYRYDGPTKQWKERGVGDFKILYNGADHKYRLLQRREQVHKLCCNHYLTPTMELRPMATSETAWCWYATDYSEGTQGTNEQLAIKFKTRELAAEFKAKFEECQNKLQEASSAHGSTSIISNESDEIEDDDEEQDNTTIMFKEHCVLYKKEKDTWVLQGRGTLQVEYDDEVYGAHMCMMSEECELLADHFIAIQTTMHKEDLAATWTVLDLVPQPGVPTTFKAEFKTRQILEKFASAFKEGKEYAQSSGILENFSADVAPDSLFYDQSADSQGDQSRDAVPFRACDPQLTSALSDFFHSSRLNFK
ncbi:E3 SUMO-protein ligase RanBP2-like isoform X2 [Oratosquilla oratoria]|uniref:E3 SUMO-protein ligase RanBP2-like isoform X2 n=1 Tax=Oratosquilla oratoria TaxID=337810 RepID=UPI003F75EACC